MSYNINCTIKDRHGRCLFNVDLPFPHTTLSELSADIQQTLQHLSSFYLQHEDQPQDPEGGDIDLTQEYKYEQDVKESQCEDSDL